MKTDICSIIGIEYPIFQGGMAWIATAELAAAVSNAGGLGIIGAGNAPGFVIKEEIKKVKQLTNKPFGVNIMLLSTYVEEIVDIVCDEKVSVVTTGAGNPGKYIKRFKENNIKVIPVVPSVALAKKMEQEGVDAVIAEGNESGGHIGELTTMALVPQVVDALSIPVIAAGGIADGRGVLAAFALGAKGVQLGTVFVCSSECKVHENYKNAIIKASDRSTIVTAKATGHPVRMLKNKLSRKFQALEQEGSKKEDYEKLGMGTLQLAAISGDIENGSIMAGQISGMISETKSVEKIIREIIENSDFQLQKLKGIMGR